MQPFTVSCGKFYTTLCKKIAAVKSSLNTDFEL